MAWNSAAYNTGVHNMHRILDGYRTEILGELADEHIPHRIKQALDVIQDDEKRLSSNIRGSFKRLTVAGRKIINGTSPLDPDMAYQHRANVHNSRGVEDIVFVLDETDSPYSGILGVSLNPETNIVTAYMSDIVRYIHPEHDIGVTLKRVLQRATDTKGVLGQKLLFPPCYNEGLFPFKSARNDGSAIAVQFQLNYEGDEVDERDYTFQAISVDFVRFDVRLTKDCFRFINYRSIERILNAPNRENFAELGYNNINVPFNTRDAAHFHRLYNLIRGYHVHRHRNLAGNVNDLRRLYYPYMRNAATVELTSLRPNRHSTDDRLVSINPPRSQDFSEVRAQGLFNEIAKAANHAIGLYCSQRGLPIVYRSTLRNNDGDINLPTNDNQMCDSVPYNVAEAGMGAFAPTVEARHSALAYANQYLLYKHLGLRTYHGRVRARTFTYDNIEHNIDEIDYTAFINNVHPDGYLRFAQLVHSRALCQLEANDWIKRHCIALELHSLFQRNASYPLPFRFRVEITYFVTRVPPAANDENGSPAYNGSVYIHNFGLSVPNVTFRGDEERIWDDLQAQCNRNGQMQVLLTNVTRRGQYEFTLDARSERPPEYRIPYQSMMFGNLSN